MTSIGRIEKSAGVVPFISVLTEVSGKAIDQSGQRSRHFHRQQMAVIRDDLKARRGELSQHQISLRLRR